MIIEVKLANYRSIHAEQTLSFVAEKARRHPQNTIQRPGYRLLKAAALFGANASGKSNFVRAIGEMRDFVRDSATKMNDGDPIACAQPYRLDPESREKPSRFEIVFVTDGVQYTYGFAATRERVHEEWLTATRENRNHIICEYKRTWNDKLQSTPWSFSGLKKSDCEILIGKTRRNALGLSVAAQFNVEELLPAYRYIRESIRFYSMVTDAKMLLRRAARRSRDNGQFLAQLTSLAADADTGIKAMGVRSYAQSDWESELRPQLGTTRFDTRGQDVVFSLEQDESTGTQRLVALAGEVIYTLERGAFLVIDELDASMHPLLTRRLLEMFQSTQANPNGAQLLFTTHDAVLLDSVLFRRDQIILAEKCDNESRFYSLADIVPPPRSTASFLNNYLVGRYGAIAHFGPAFDMLTVGSAK